MRPNRELEILLKVISDQTSDLTEKDDALIALGKFDDDQALNALVKAASDKDERSIIASSAAESISEILIRRKIRNPTFLSQLRRDAAKELEELLAANDI